MLDLFDPLLPDTCDLLGKLRFHLAQIFHELRFGFKCTGVDDFLHQFRHGMERDLNKDKKTSSVISPSVKNGRAYNTTSIREEIPFNVCDYGLPHISSIVEQYCRCLGIPLLRVQIVWKDPVSAKVDREYTVIPPATLSPISASSSSGVLSRTTRSNNPLQSRAFS